MPIHPSSDRLLERAWVCSCILAWAYPLYLILASALALLGVEVKRRLYIGIDNHVVLMLYVCMNVYIILCKLLWKCTSAAVVGIRIRNELAMDDYDDGGFVVVVVVVVHLCIRCSRGGRVGSAVCAGQYSQAGCLCRWKIQSTKNPGDYSPSAHTIYEQVCFYRA